MMPLSVMRPLMTGAETTLPSSTIARPLADVGAGQLAEGVGAVGVEAELDDRLVELAEAGRARSSGRGR